MSGDKVQVRLSGFGGQGIILAGEILGMAVTLHEGRNAVLTQSFGPEARGGACSADVVVSDGRIYYPCVTVPDVLVLMSEEAARTYGPTSAEDALVLVNEDLVRTEPTRSGLRIHRIPATRTAESLGRVMVANIVMLGFITALTQFVSPEAMTKALLESVPPGTEKLNLSAFQAGFEHGERSAVSDSR